MDFSNSKKKLRHFGFIIAFGLPFFVGWLMPLIFGHSFRNWTLFIAIPFLIIAIIKPNLLDSPFKIWMRIGHILGWLNSHIILGIVFIFILIPISIFMKIFNYDPLRKNLFKHKSYRESKKEYKIDLKRIF